MPELGDLLRREEMAVITSEDIEIAYIAQRMPKSERKIVLINPSTHILYHGYEEKKQLEALGTARNGFYDADKYTFAARHAIARFGDLKDAFVQLGFTFKEL